MLGQADAAHGTVAEGDGAADTAAQSVEENNAQPNGTQQMFPAMGFNMPAGGFPNMPFNGNGDFNPMQFMSNGMFNQSPMGMSPPTSPIALRKSDTDFFYRNIWDVDGPDGREPGYVWRLRDGHEQWHECGNEFRRGSRDVCWGMGRLSEQYVEWRPR